MPIPSLSKSDLQSLAESKAEDARLLQENGRFGNAYYLAGYAVELALKAIIAREFSADAIPDKGLVNRVYTHDLGKLVVYAELQDALDMRRRGDTLFETNWLAVTGWTEESRYWSADPQRAADMVAAVIDEPSGVLPWLRTFW